MRQVFVHQAELNLTLGGDRRAPGGAVTMALCGHWGHRGACRWPHHTAAARGSGGAVTVRTLFACDPAEEQLVRERILSAFRTGRLDGPSGLTTWTVVDEAASTIAADEQPTAARLTANGPG